jgi:hypothetical protein
MENNIEDEIRILQTRIQVESDTIHKQDLQKRLRRLQLEKEIQDIRRRMEQLG